MGTLPTVIVMPYLPPFWRAIGLYLRPRNAYILLHNTIYTIYTIYFHGNGCVTGCDCWVSAAGGAGW